MVELRRRALWLLACTLGWTTSGCSACPKAGSPPPTAATSATPPPASAASATATIPSGARFVFAPRAGWLPRAERAVPSGTLYVGDDGLRWLVPEKGAPLAAQLAPEGLAGTLPTSHGYVFFSTTGRLYGADTPLAELVPLGPAARARAAAAGKQHLVLITENGLRFSPDAGRTWNNSEIERHAALTDLVMLENGAGLALSEREELFVTRDDARSFSRVDTGTVTFTRLASVGLELRAVEADELSGDYRYRKVDPASGMANTTNRHPPIGPLAPWDWFAEVLEVETSALRTGSAWLAVRARDADTRFQISLAPFGSPPEFRDVPALDGCRVTSRDVGALTLLANCPKSSPNLTLFYSAGPGEAWESRALDGVSSASSTLKGKSLYRLSDSELLVNRTCQSAPGPLVVSTRDLGVVPVSEPRCHEHLAFSEPGAAALFSLAFSEQEGLTLHSWKDRRPTLLGTALAAPVDPVQAGVTVTASGAVLVTVEKRDRGWSLLRSLDHGKTFAELPLPSPTVQALSMSGERGLLLDAEAHALETNDGGATWRRVEFPLFARPFVLECVPEGCRTSFGFRMGWDAP